MNALKVEDREWLVTEVFFENEPSSPAIFARDSSRRGVDTLIAICTGPRIAEVIVAEHNAALKVRSNHD